MARVLEDYNSAIELGYDIDLDHLLTKLVIVFPPALASD
jgi:hypothetical protein